MAAAAFAGFPQDLFSFLAQLGLHNEREWFEAHKGQYEASVREPALAFIRAMEPKLRRLSPHFVASDKKVGGSLMRVHRDVRFSKDKTPYKTNVGIQFRHAAGKDVHAPGLYLHMEPGRIFVGVGMWRPAAEPLAMIRAAIVQDPKRWRRVRDGKAFAGTYVLGGDALKRPPRGFDPEHPCIEDLKRKDFIATTDLKVGQLTSPKAVDEVAGTFALAKPLLQYLCACVDVEF